jgi:hypothetical protein
MAFSMAGSSKSKSAVSGTPTKSSPCSVALMAYITKPGKGARMTGFLPVTASTGTSQAMAKRNQFVRACPT